MGPNSGMGPESRRAEGEAKTDSAKEAEAEGARGALRWLDETTMVNFAGIEFKQYPAPRDALGGRQYPPFPERPDLTPAIDWRYNDHGFLISTRPITHRQYLQVMGKMAEEKVSRDPEKVDLPVTNLSFHNVEAFVHRINELEPDGVGYFIPDLNAWAFAAYGEVMLRFPDECDAIEKFLISGGQSPLSSSSLSAQGDAWLPRIESPFGDSWEWVSTFKRRPQKVEGIVSYADQGPGRDAAELLVVGNPNTELFTHCFDTFCGANDYFVSAENVQLFRETNGITQYFCPMQLGHPAAITYRYQAEAPIVTAAINPQMYCYKEGDQCGIEIRARKPESAIPLAEIPWVKVLERQGRYIDAPALEISPFVAGATEFEIRYWVLTHEKPYHYSQIFRGSQSVAGKRGLYSFVQWTTLRETPGVAPTGPVAAYHRDPKITVRLGAWLPKGE